MKLNSLNLQKGNYLNKGGNNPLVFGKYAADIIVSSAMLLASGPAVPFMIIGATIYFIADLYTDGFGFDYSTPIPKKIKNEEDEDKNENIN